MHGSGRNSYEYSGRTSVSLARFEAGNSRGCVKWTESFPHKAQLMRACPLHRSAIIFAYDHLLLAKRYELTKGN